VALIGTLKRIIKKYIKGEKMTKKQQEKEMTREERIENFCVDENEVRRDEEISLSGKYRLLIRYYKTKEGCWNYSRGTVYRISDKKEICDIKRNYSSFTHSFIEKNNQEWLITGRSYMSQTIINLDTGEEFEPGGDQYNGFAFCWINTHLSPDENTLVVEGCHWACPYEYRFFDFTDPSKGWSALSTEECIYADDKRPTFEENGDIVCYQTDKIYLPLGKFENEMSIKELEVISDDDFDDDDNWEEVENVRITLRRSGDTMKIVDKWISESERKRIEQRRIANENFEKWMKEFKLNDPLYLEYKELLENYKLPAEKYEAHGITYDGWCPDFKKRETRWCRRIVKHEGDKGYTVDLSWAVETGPIKLRIFKDGKTSESKFYEHSVDGMRQAFNFARELSTRNTH
jgi:hypothetical protein